ncbi:MAG: response regulator transcription factor [Oscillospiraceae bacterium]|nr:response regulator transcription factor [Oscillospiraceae bacterium]
MLRIAIVDNDLDACDQMQIFIRRYARSEGLDITTDEFDRADKFLSQYKPVYDVIFMGIEMPGLDGMEAAKRLRKKDTDVVLVFVTGMARYAIRGYEVDALDFVLKPLNYYAFSIKLERALQRVRQRAGENVILKTSEGVRRIDLRQIYYLETKSRMLYYHTSTGVYSVRGTLQSAEEMLAEYSFAKCNQCYLVNLQHVTDVRDDCVVVAGTTLEISRRNKKSFLSAVVAYIGGVR